MPLLRWLPEAPVRGQSPAPRPSTGLITDFLTQPDGRPHAMVTSYIRRGTTFWLTMVADTAPEATLQANPWLTLTVIDGDPRGYIGIQIEGPAEPSPPKMSPATCAPQSEPGCGHGCGSPRLAYYLAPQAARGLQVQLVAPRS